MAQKIKAARRIAGMTQQEAAARLGLDLAEYRRVERGESVISSDALLAVAEVFGVSTDFLLVGDADLMEAELVQRFRSMSPSARLAVLGIARELTKELP